MLAELLITKLQEFPPPSKRLKSDSPVVPNGAVQHFVKQDPYTQKRPITKSASSATSSQADSGSRTDSSSHHKNFTAITKPLKFETSFKQIQTQSLTPNVAEQPSIKGREHEQPEALARPSLSRAPSPLERNSRPPSVSQNSRHARPVFTFNRSQVEGATYHLNQNEGLETDESDSDNSHANILDSFKQPIADLRRPKKPQNPANTYARDSTTPAPLRNPDVTIPHRSSPAATPGPSLPISSQNVSQVSPLGGFQLVVPLSQDKLPTRQRPDWRKKRQKLFEALRVNKNAPDEGQLAEIEEYFGQTGFSAAYGTGDSERLLKGASKKLRELNGTAVILDWHDGDTKSHLDSDGSTFDMSSLLHPIEQVKQILTARFDKSHRPSLVFANDVNDRRLNGKFQFVSQYILCDGVRLADPRLNSGCNCPGGVCDPLTCRCLPRAADYSYIERVVSTYEAHPSTGATVLNETYMLNEMDPTGRHFEISECNELCSCGPDCWNRVVGRGRTIPLEVFETARCGFGVRSSVDIARGQFIELYLGEVITQRDLERRENAKEENQSSYIYSLDWFKSQDCYHVDGENFGTAMRFVNHNCDPNARNFTVIRNKADKNVYHLAFFAIKDIKAGEEICIDYSPQNAVLGDDDYEEGVTLEATDYTAEDEGRARCYCGAPNCRKWLWRDPGRKRKRRKRTKHG